MSNKKQQQYLEASKGCPMYKACPICFACENKAVHQYEQCQTCTIPIDHHNHVGKSYMIRRKNFEITVAPETLEKFKEMEEAVHVD